MLRQNPRKRPAHILLVEDDQADSELVRQALSDASLPLDLHRAADGVEAVQFVRREGQFARVPRPDLVILDLGLPRQDGHDVLAAMKSDQELKSIPVVVLSGSQEERDVWKAYHLHANAYVVKPSNAQDFLTAVRRLAEFYLLYSELAPPGRPVNGNGA